MVFATLLASRPRKLRERSVREMAAALNSLDYDRVEAVVSDDLIVAHAGGRRTRGRAAFIEDDRVFRTEAGGPQIFIDDLIHHDDEVLVRGRLEGEDPDFGGPTMWRVTFDGKLIDRVEITRENHRN